MAAPRIQVQFAASIHGGDHSRSTSLDIGLDIDQQIARLTGDQHGVVMRAQLLATGATPKAVGSRLASKRLVALHRGVYLLGALAGPFEPARAREMAAVLACGRRRS